jgi:hypothetical protein
MNFAIISENYFSSTTSFTCVDNREAMYSRSTYEPTSACESIVWEGCGRFNSVGHIADNGDLCVSKEFAELVMSFDPYGIESYPAEIRCEDGSLKNRYVLALNNLIDVMDEDKSEIRKSPKRNKMLVMELFVSEEKLKSYPLQKRVLFRVEGAEIATIFCEEVYNLITADFTYFGLRTMKLNCDTQVPEF